MKKFILIVSLVINSPLYAGTLNVPDDFPGSFHMDLLNGFAVFDFDPAYGSSGYIGDIPLDTSTNQILFSASAFDGIGGGAGTSTLALEPVNMNIGTSTFFGNTISFYLDGSGSGTLVDLDGTQGDWTLNLPLFADWITNTVEFPEFSLSSAASYQYAGPSHQETIDGLAMDYASGNTFLVGQSTIADPNSPFKGARVTIGIYANDPTIVPLPATMWLFSSGLFGLVGVLKRRNAVQLNRDSPF
jgi:hypothetical protein